jgi:hypothetical protein
MSITPDLFPDTRRFKSVTIHAKMANGATLSVECKRIGSAIAMQGLGYSGGYNDRKGLGAWRGDDVVEEDVWNIEHPARIIYPGEREPDEHWHRIQPVAVQCTLDDAQYEGHGSMTLTLGGRISSLGLGG